MSATRNATDLTQALVTWAAGGSETEWKLQYGPTGFTLGNGTVATATENTKILTGLSATQVYDVYVSATCSATDSSNWTGPVQITLSGGNPTSFFKVDFNSATFNATSTLAYIAGGHILITGIRGTNGEQFAFILNGTTAGTYASTEDLMGYTTDAAAEYEFNNFENENFDPNTGSVTITSINPTTHTIAGTFHFTGYWSDYTDTNPPAPIEFTNGSFSMTYSESTGADAGFSATIDGTDFGTTLAGAAEVTLEGQSVLGIGGTNNADNELSISFKSGLPPGTYDIDGLDADLASGKYTIGDTDFTATSGLITITSYTASHVKGTFNFTATNTATMETHQVANGTFDIDY
ncbi:DUF6252 family protein [Flavobacterium sp. 3HN19-14]|uniref:DUF6252 family protein n=1 Tax=Flavobacterium sp. 3HN19-14 TaxID=3448133 RepID=UPI003EE286F8